VKKLLANLPKNSVPNLFYSQLRDMFDSNDPLVALAGTINWDTFNDFFVE